MVRARSGGTSRLVIGWLCWPTGFRFAISTHLVLVDQLMFSVPNASAPLATRVFTQGPGPRQHRRRAQPASRESRLGKVSKPALRQHVRRGSVAEVGEHGEHAPVVVGGWGQVQSG